MYQKHVILRSQWVWLCDATSGVNLMVSLFFFSIISFLSKFSVAKYGKMPPDLGLMYHHCKAFNYSHICSKLFYFIQLQQSFFFALHFNLVLSCDFSWWRLLSFLMKIRKLFRILFYSFVRTVPNLPKCTYFSHIVPNSMLHVSCLFFFEEFLCYTPNLHFNV